MAISSSDLLRHALHCIVTACLALSGNARRASETAVQQTYVRLEQETLERADRVAAELAKKVEGVKPSQSMALRLAITRGLDLLEQELGMKRVAKK